MSLIDELKRRNVFRVAAAYLALGWVVTQVTGTIAPAMHLPDWTIMFVVWIGVIGFPFVVVFSWVFELTPEGLKRERDVEPTDSITPHTGRRLDYIIIGMLALAMLMFIYDRMAPRHDAPVTAPPVAESGASLPPVVPTSAAPVAPVTAPDDRSIAVLPFVNMSEDASNEYFADGISEELLNVLAKIPELKVIARTSSFAFKGQNAKIADVARELRVAHVLEGSVRKSGNRVRITAQLVRAADSMHLWSESYDRTLDDVFAVQTEIAGAVVAQLKITLLGAAPQVKKADAKAYALYLQALQLYRQGTAAGFEQSIAVYQQALAIDPGYAAAWVGLADTYRREAGQAMRPLDEGYALAREAVNKALAIDPEFALAHAVLGRIALDADNDLAATAQQLERAVALDPSNLDIISNAAVLTQYLSHLDQAIALAEYVVERDPVNAAGHANLGISYFYAGRLDEAAASARTVVALSPGRINAQYQIGMALLLKGDANAALTEMQKEADESWRLMGLTMVYHTLGQAAESTAALDALIAKYEKDSAYNIAYVLAWRGETDRAFEWLDKALAYHDPGLVEIVVTPLFASIHEDARWVPFLRKLGKAPEQLAAIKFEVKLP